MYLYPTQSPTPISLVATPDQEPDYKFVTADHRREVLTRLVPGGALASFLAYCLLEWRSCYGEHEYQYQIRRLPWLATAYQLAERDYSVALTQWPVAEAVFTKQGAADDNRVRQWLADIKPALIRPLVADLVDSLLVIGSTPQPDQLLDLQQRLQALGL